MRYTGFLCGGFSVKEGRRDPGNMWSRIVYTEEQIRGYESYYLPEFVRFNLDSTAVGFGSMTRYEMKLDKKFDLAVPVTVSELKLYMLPFGMALFAIRVDIETEDLNGITATMANLRNLGKIASQTEFAAEALAPVVETYCRLTDCSPENFDYMKLVEDGNKLKIFQIALIDGDAVKDKDVLLFEIGCVAPIDSYDEKYIYSASESYFRKLMTENKLSIYNNWSCLGLSDTLTILAENCPDWLVDNWTKDYFGLIYIWQLFRKNYIFRLTKRFRFEKDDPQKLVKEAFEFDKTCSFNTISYNFLPEEFSGCIENGLRIEEDKKVLYLLLEQENTAREKTSDSKMNYLLFFMTCLTVFSAIYDACSLFNEMYSYEDNIGSGEMGFRLVASGLTSLILIVLLLNRFFKRNN